MENGCLIVVFAVLGVIALVVAVAAVGGILSANDTYAEFDGVVVQVHENERTNDGVTTGGNATVVVMDGWHMFLASSGGLYIAFFIGAWAIMALAMVASLSGLTD